MSKGKKDDRLKQVAQEGDEKPEVYGIVKDREGFRVGRRSFFGSLGIGMLARAAGCSAPSRRMQTQGIETTGPPPSVITGLCSGLKAHFNWVSSLAISPDGKTLVSGSSDNTIRLWGLPEGTPGPCLFAPASTEKGTRVGEYRQMGKQTFTLPCGSPIPPGGTCICNCVAGSGQYSGTETVCILNKCINIPCKRFRSPDFIGLKSVPDIFAGIHRWWLLAPL